MVTVTQSSYILDNVINEKHADFEVSSLLHVSSLIIQTNVKKQTFIDK